MNGWWQDSSNKDVQEQKEHMAAGTLRMDVPGPRHHHIMPLCWKVASPFSSSLRPLLCLPVLCYGSHPIPWPWLCSHGICPALLLLSFIPQLVPSPCPPSHSIPPRLHSLHCTQGSRAPVYIITLQVFYLWTRCSFLPHLHWWSDRFPPWEATGVFPRGPCAWGSAWESKAQAWETWMHHQWANVTLLSSIFKIGCPRAAEQRACSALTLFHQNKFILIETSLRVPPGTRGKMPRLQWKEQHERKTIHPSEEEGCPVEPSTGAGLWQSVIPLPSLLLVICAPVSAASPVADGNALRHQRLQTTSLL